LHLEEHRSQRREHDLAGERMLLLGLFLRPEDRHRIDAALSGEAGEGNHLGLANIANRLRLLYGSQARLTISGGPGEETVVEIHVPQTAEEDPEGNQMIACQKKKENRND
jgi:hypothetical protein